MLHWQAKLLALVACALLLSAARARAQERPITWTLKVNSSARAFKPGDTFKVQVTAQISAGWHVYATSQPRGGPKPTSFMLPPDQPFKLAGLPSAPPPLTSFDASFDLPTKFYEKSVTFTLSVLITADASAGQRELQLVVAFQSCSKQVCLPVKKVPLKTSVEVASTKPKTAHRKRH